MMESDNNENENELSFVNVQRTLLDMDSQSITDQREI